MIVRFGYVAIPLELGDKGKTSGTVTYKNYEKMQNADEKMNKLKAVTLKNLDNLGNAINYNIENEIHFYRITSALIPLVTHPNVGYWGHREIFKKNFQYIGRLIEKSNMRVDTHPDQFNVINSTNEEVVKNTVINLMEHVNLFEDLNYDKGMMVIHVGGAAGGKEEGLQRFIDNLKSYPESIKERLIIENDDKIYNSLDVLKLCSEINAPMVLDVHHHMCNNCGEDLSEVVAGCFATYKGKKVIPKIHFSSPKDGECDRKHADYINVDDFISFLKVAKGIETDDKEIEFDIMIEAKKKDIAMFKLIDDIKSFKPEYLWIDKTTLRA